MATGAGAIFGNPMNGLNTWSSPQGGGTQGGSNQWMSFPALPNFGSGGGSGTWAPGQAGKPGQFFQQTPGGKHDMGGGMFTAPTFDPATTGQFYSMIQQLMQGGGGHLQDQLLSFLGGGPSSIPGASTMTSMANTGNPISALPEWQQMIQAQQRNIGENAANLKEQFAFAGDLQSSPFGTASTDFWSQTTKDQNALLAQLEQQSMESAMQRELAASTSLTGMAGAESQFLDSLFSGAATASPGMFDKHKSSMLGGIGSLIKGGAAGAGAGLAAADAGAGGIGAILAGLAAI